MTNKSHKAYKSSLLVVFCCVFMISCGKDAVDFEVPATYEFQRDGVSTVSFSGQTTRITMATELLDAMSAMNVGEEALLEMLSNRTAQGDDADPYSDEVLNASTKSVKSKIAASTDFFSSNTVESADIKKDFESWIHAHIEEIISNHDQLAQRGQAGQIADGSIPRYVNAQGLEYNQAVNKSLIGALMVDQICNNYLSISVLDAGDNISNNDLGLLEVGKTYTTMEHKWDEAYGYLFGAASDIQNPLSNLGEDAFLNKYLSKVDADEDFAGIAKEIYDAFKLGRAALVAGEYQTRDEQIEILRERISEVIAIRAVYYLQAGKKVLASGDMGGAFHDLSEGYGFIYSLRFTRQSDNNASYFTRDEVDEYLSELTRGNGFWDLTAETLDQISNDIAAKFSFTVEEAAE